jgi:hypothetical protein
MIFMALLCEVERSGFKPRGAGLRGSRAVFQLAGALHLLRISIKSGGGKEGTVEKLTGKFILDGDKAT